MKDIKHNRQHKIQKHFIKILKIENNDINLYKKFKIYNFNIFINIL